MSIDDSGNISIKEKENNNILNISNGKKDSDELNDNLNDIDIKDDRKDKKCNGGSYDTHPKKKLTSLAFFKKLKRAKKNQLILT